MQKLFDNSQGYTLFTKLGSDMVVAMQNTIANQVEQMKRKDVDPEDIKEVLKMFLNEDAIKKLRSIL